MKLNKYNVKKSRFVCAFHSITIIYIFDHLKVLNNHHLHCLFNNNFETFFEKVS